MRIEMDAVIDRVRANCLNRTFPTVPAADRWLAGFDEEKDRYPFLLVVGPSRSGKTEWAKALFKAAGRSFLELKIGPLEQFPEGMRQFSRKRHAAIILDDVRDLSFLVRHQEKVQGKYDGIIEFGTTPGGQCSFSRWLWKVPVVVTTNFSDSAVATKNRSLLATDDFLGNAENRVVVHFPPEQQ